MPGAAAQLLEVLRQHRFGDADDGFDILPVGDAIGTLIGARRQWKLLERCIGAAQHQPSVEIVGFVGEALRELRGHRRRRIRHGGRIHPGIVAERRVQPRAT